MFFLRHTTHDKCEKLVSVYQRRGVPGQCMIPKTVKTWNFNIT